MNYLETIKESYATIKKGGLSLAKADIGYGLFGHSEISIKKMYVLKGRPLSNPCIAAANIHILQDVALLKNMKLLEWIEDISSKTTLAVINPANIQSAFILKLSAWVKNQLIVNNTIATFLNTGKYIEPMIEFGIPDNILLVGSSGNLSSYGNNYTFNDVPKKIIDGVDYFYDAGDSKYKNNEKLATTILNFDNFSVKRVGVNSDMILESYHSFARKNGLPNLT